VSTETAQPHLDIEAAQRVHYVDPRVRQLAYARYLLATGRSHSEWLALGKNHSDALIEEARDWLRAAVAAGFLSPAEESQAAREWRRTAVADGLLPQAPTDAGEAP
jgi:hypothetical protein